jgi:hypothetical protein
VSWSPLPAVGIGFFAARVTFAVPVNKPDSRLTAAKATANRPLISRRRNVSSSYRGERRRPAARDAPFYPEACIESIPYNPASGENDKVVSVSIAKCSVSFFTAMAIDQGQVRITLAKS